MCVQIWVNTLQRCKHDPPLCDWLCVCERTNETQERREKWTEIAKRYRAGDSQSNAQACPLATGMAEMHAVKPTINTTVKEVGGEGNELQITPLTAPIGPQLLYIAYARPTAHVLESSVNDDQTDLFHFLVILPFACFWSLVSTWTE